MKCEICGERYEHSKHGLPPVCSEECSDKWLARFSTALEKKKAVENLTCDDCGRSMILKGLSGICTQCFAIRFDNGPGQKMTVSLGRRVGKCAESEEAPPKPCSACGVLTFGGRCWMCTVDGKHPVPKESS